MEQHIGKTYPFSLTARYNLSKLVYYRFFSTIQETIAEEKRIKAGNRLKKMQLIEIINPPWDDLWLKEVSKG